MCILSGELMIKIKPQLNNKKRLLGEGGTSFVYKVNCINEKNEYDQNSKTFYALKVIKNNVLYDTQKVKILDKWDDDNSGDDDDNDEEEVQIDISKIQKFFQEFEIICLLKHPNIIKSFGFFFGNKETPPCILLEYFKHNLDNSIKLLEDVYLVSIIYEICHAMNFIHKNGLIHRDLKPANILLDAEKHVKISDFGISTLIPTETQTTQSFSFGGTRGFIAPELFQQSKYNEKVDVYSFGVVVHFILTKGEYPITGTFDINKNMHLSKKINKNSQELIRNCLSISPDERPSFAEIIDFINNRKMNMVDGIDIKNSTLHSQLDKVLH